MGQCISKACPLNYSDSHPLHGCWVGFNEFLLLLLLLIAFGKVQRKWRNPNAENPNLGLISRLFGFPGRRKEVRTTCLFGDLKRQIQSDNDLSFPT